MVNAGIGCDISSEEVHLGLENNKQHTVSDKISLLSIANVNSQQTVYKFCFLFSFVAEM